MSPAFIPGKGRLILFGRYPVPGRTKTRLMPVLGHLGAAELQRRLTLQSLDTLQQPGLPPVTFQFAGGSATRVRQWLADRAIDCRPQQGGDLGTRMRQALYDALALNDGPAVLVGTDIPRMRAHHLKTAFQALDRYDVVLGPSRDGGYWLVGLRRPVDIFDGIAWGTQRVREQTLDAIRSLGLSVAPMAELDDIDTEADLRHWLPESEWPRPYLSIIIPTLNEADTIRATIARVRDNESEIIVADGGSRDATIESARTAGVRVIAAGRGRARQQNQGASAARGRVLLFLHADTRLPADFGRQIFETLLPPDVIAGAFQFKTDYEHWQMRWVERAAHLRARRFQLPYGDQGLFMTRSTFERAGGFDDVPIAEDLFLVRRLAKAGRIVLAPGEAVTSGRRWRAIGIWRATLVNYLIAAGCLAGMNPARLAPLYRWGVNPVAQGGSQTEGHSIHDPGN